MKMRLVSWAAALAAAALVLACTAGGEVKVGVAGPLTGPEAETGKGILQGVQLAADQLNAQGGVRGKKVVVVAADDGDDPARVEQAAQDLVRQKVAFVVGHVDSGCSLKAAEIYKAHKIVMISAASSAPALTDAGNPFVFRVFGRDDDQSKAAAVWLVKHMPGHLVAVVHDGTPYGKGLAEKFKGDYEFLQEAKVAFVEEVPRGTSDFEPLLAKLAEAKPQLIYFGGLATQGSALLKAVRAKGLPVGFMSGDGCFGEKFIRDAGAEAANGALATWMDDLSGRPAYRDWLVEYQGKYGAPEPFARFGYTAAMVGLKGYEQAVYPVTASTLTDALHRLTFDTHAGPFTFNDKGDRTASPYVIWTVVDGKWEEIHED